MTSEYEVAEYGTRAVPRSAAGELVAASNGKLRHEMIDGIDHVRASSWVGTVRAGDHVVRVVPKIGFRNVFALLLEVADAPFLHLEGTAPLDEDDDAVTVLVALFARTVTELLRQGPLRGYREVHTTEVALRGRLDLATLLRRPGIRTPVPCRWEEFGADIDLNRHLLAAVHLARRAPGLPIAERRMLDHARLSLEGVGHAAPPPSFLEQRHLTRLETHYAPALHLATLVRLGGGLSHATGDVTTGTLLLDMNKVFESYVGTWLQRDLAGTVDVSLQDISSLDRDEIVEIRPDIVLRDPSTDRVSHVIDVKYKIADDVIGRNADYYQLLSYCIAHDVSAGTLVYAGRLGQQLPKSVVPRHQDVRLRAHAVDLRDSRRDREMAALRDGLLGLSLELIDGR